MGILMKAVQSFQAKFKNSGLRATEGRAERVLKGDAVGEIAAAKQIFDKLILADSYSRAKPVLAKPRRLPLPWCRTAPPHLLSVQRTAQVRGLPKP